MQLHTLKRKTELKTSERVGRGGTRGKTSGRGTKGQNARSGRKKRPEERDIIKKLPKLRGRGKNSNLTIQTRTISVDLKVFENAPKGEISTRSLVALGIIKKKGKFFPSVKILGGGKVNNALNFKGIKVSASAKKAIEAAGGSVNE
jgi:large subunit ribosomal protein L15